MTEYLYMTTDLNLFLILSSLLISISILGLYFIRWFLPLHIRYQENEVIGCTSALIIVIYGVLAGFATLYLIDNKDHASQAMQQEANGVANLYRESLSLSNPLREQIQSEIRNYANEVLHVEWPLMNQDKMVVSNGDLDIQKLTQLYAQNKSTVPGESLILADMVAQTSELYNARQQRIQDSYTSLSSTIWVVLLIGTILSICVSLLFGVNFYLHIFIVLAAALMAASILFLMIGLDKPFVGEYNVGPEAIQNVLTAIDHQKPA